MLQILQLETVQYFGFLCWQKHQPTQTVPVVGGVYREAPQRCIMAPQVLWEWQRAGKCYLLWKSAACGNTLFSFSFLNFLASFGSAHHSLCLPIFIFPLYLWGVEGVCICKWLFTYTTLWLHTSNPLCSTNPVSDVFLLPLN